LKISAFQGLLINNYNKKRNTNDNNVSNDSLHILNEVHSNEQYMPNLAQLLLIGRETSPSYGITISAIVVLVVMAGCHCTVEIVNWHNATNAHFASCTSGNCHTGQ